jgi:hypothetical protein
MNANTLGCVASGAVVGGTNVKHVGTVRGMPQVAKSTTATIVGAEKHLGMALHDAADGEDLLVQPHDGSVVDIAVAGGALVPGTNDELTTDANGKYIAAAAGDVVLGSFIGPVDSDATDGTAADTEKVRIILRKYNWAA